MFPAVALHVCRPLKEERTMKTPMSEEKHNMLAGKVGMTGDWNGDQLADECAKTMDAQQDKLKEHEANLKSMGDDLADHKKKLKEAMDSAKGLADDNKEMKVKVAASAAPQTLSAMEQMALGDSVSNIAERIVRKGIMTPQSVDAVVANFKAGDGFAVVAASASPQGSPLLRSVLLSIEAAQPGVPTGAAAVVAASAGVPAANPAAPDPNAGKLKQGQAAQNYISNTYGSGTVAPVRR